MVNIKGKTWDIGESKLITKINQESRLIYYFKEFEGLSTKITVQGDWIKYIVKIRKLSGDGLNAK